MSKPAKTIFIRSERGEVLVVPQIKSFSLEEDLEGIGWEVRVNGGLVLSTVVKSEAQQFYHKIWEAIEEFYQ